MKGGNQTTQSVPERFGQWPSGFSAQPSGLQDRYQTWQTNFQNRFPNGFPQGFQNGMPPGLANHFQNWQTNFQDQGGWQGLQDRFAQQYPGGIQDVMTQWQQRFPEGFKRFPSGLDALLGLGGRGGAPPPAQPIPTEPAPVEEFTRPVRRRP